MEYIYGPVPSRRLGLSLGVSPIPKKTCNYSCIYCQLGRTNPLTNTRKEFFPLKKIIDEFENILKRDIEFDVITIVGEGEPTLYLYLGDLICQIKSRTKKPVAVITNGALLYESQLRLELAQADIVLPTMDAYDEASFKKINRPHGKLKFSEVYDGLTVFSKEYQGQLWLEMMLIANVNDDDAALRKYYDMLKDVNYDRLYLNTPVRPPAESYSLAVNHDSMRHAVEILGGISIDLLVSKGFHSEITDDYAAILSIIKRHPMNQFEIENFLKTRNCDDIEKVFEELERDRNVKVINYKGYYTYRME